MAWLVACLLVGATPRPALEVRLVRPDRQLERLLALFEGAPAAHPAAALAAWKRAAGGRTGLTKAEEAAITLLNPQMIPELRLLDGARLAVAFERGGPDWWASIPHDDGTFAAFATALALSGGGPDPPLDGRDVDRLGPPGTPVMTTPGDSVAVASSRDGLAAALRQLDLPAPPGPGPESGTVFRLDPDALADAESRPLRRLAGALQGVGAREVRGELALSGASLSLALATSHDGSWPGRGAIDPAWLDWIPAERVLAAASVALDPSPGAIDAAFALADRVERADPARAGVAPLRARLDLLGLAAGVRPEVDLWPALCGITACALSGPDGAIDGALIVLHAVDDDAAGRIAGEILPRLAGPLLRVADEDWHEDEQDGARRLGRWNGLPVRVAHREDAVLIGWGEGVLPRVLTARADPPHSAGPTLRAAWDGLRPSRVGALWPARLPGSPVADAPPILWHGSPDGALARDVIRWDGLREPLRRLLDRLPKSE